MGNTSKSILFIFPLVLLGDAIETMAAKIKTLTTDDGLECRYIKETTSKLGLSCDWASFHLY